MPSTAVLRDVASASPTDPKTYEDALATAEPGDVIATTKEEEWVTRKTSEVTTTRQIATRVKRELVLEDGRILLDSGPKISTSVNEDTHTTNFQQTEHRVPDEENGEEETKTKGGVQIEAAEGATELLQDELAPSNGEVAPSGGKVLVSSRVVANPEGKVRESHDLKVLTRNVTERVRETEERFHHGDTTHDALIAAVNETPEEDIRDALKQQTEQQLALVPRGPELVKDTVAYNTTIKTDDTRELRALRPDGTLVTETQHTREEERLCDEDLPEQEAGGIASDESVVEERGGTERRRREDLERSTDLMAGGLRLATQVHSRTRTEEVEREGQPNMDDDWDSLSVRLRRQRRLRLNDHDKDYAKRPLDFDIEEETRKKETSKWLESHFGSDSRSSHDSIAEEIGRRPEPAYYVKNKSADDEGYYGKTSSSVPPPAAYGDRVLRKTKSSTPSDERPAAPVNRTGGYFKGVADWSQRRATKPRMPEPRSSSPSPPAVRSPYASDDRLNGSSPRHVYGKRDSPQGRSSPIGRRHPPSRDDSAYVSSSTMHSPPRGSPFRPLETDRSFREPSIEDDYRHPVVPERKRHTKQRVSEEHRYDSGYRSSSRNGNSGRSRDSREEAAAEPPPDYSPPRERRGSSDRDRTPPRRRDERKQNQKTRFAENEGRRRPSPVRKSVGSAIGNSIRKLVGKIRSASAERRTRWRNSRSPSPSPEHSSRTYKQYGGELAPPVAPPHRYYLGEDPFAPSIYGREHKYEGSSRRATANDTRDHRDRGQFSSTLGRFSHSTSRLNPNSEPEEEYSRSAQTLPRKLHDRKEKTTEKPTTNKYWNRLSSNKRSTSAINISNNHVPPPQEVKINGYPPGPAKPARTYKGLNRSKSFAMGAPEQETHPRYVTGMNRNYSTMYKSNPHLSKLDETPEQLKSPGIVSIINRSQRDLADAVSRETERRRDGLFGARYGKTAPISNGHTNGYNKSYEETDKKKIFLKGLRERAPDLYQTLHADDESDGSRLSSRYGTPSPHYKDRISEERKIPLYKTESLNRESSPFVSRLETRLKSPAIRRGSNSSDNFSETYRYTTRSGDPERPSVTDTVETVSKKIVPSRDGRSKEIIESREVNSVTKSRGYKGEPISSVKYYDNRIRASPPGYELKNGSAPLYSERRSSNYKVIEKIRDY
ncbi:PREDICTED: serine/arginine repetitive matrix protein 2 isoform X2 [Papilio xuthus]|uniref:Serine/arginine repetitive matrix protein 2 isoform X2 n=1 Tax=Papilio xuthus TaxID=66420 RepID=A0AAJ6Z3X7_PAPXU|nr:PREDICTED: serine/arginine repetitive matrix protein 2 isoform X2 [Papilio xuthus]XP_013164932.1 PREDICTED: serine/arginine repetitive matrix protein 2 isoform X2 [Papilio xuthus]